MKKNRSFVHVFPLQLHPLVCSLPCSLVRSPVPFQSLSEDDFLVLLHRSLHLERSCRNHRLLVGLFSWNPRTSNVRGPINPTALNLTRKGQMSTDSEQDLQLGNVVWSDDCRCSLCGFVYHIDHHQDAEGKQISIDSWPKKI